MMVTKKRNAYIALPVLLLVVVASFANAQPAYNTKLWYKQPASAIAKDTSEGWINDPEWLKALPVGNGFIGAMVFGDVNKERLQLNEKSLWSGGPADNDNPDAPKYLNEIRSLLFAGKYKEATELTNKTQVCKGEGSGHGNGSTVPFGCFQTLGDLWLDFNTNAIYQNYYRELDLVNGIALTRYQQNGITYTREVFASYPDKALIIRLTASKPNALSFSLSIDRPEKYTTVAEDTKLVMCGTLANGAGGDGIKYKTYVTPLLTGGSLKKDNNKLIISKATSVTIIITAATNYKLSYPDYTDNNFEATLKTVNDNAIKKSYPSLREKHVKDFSAYMNRSTIQLQEDQQQHLATDELMVKNAQTNNEANLYALYYQYGRYLLLSSSRKGSLPANLQGMWANKIQTPWNGDYHTDINVQMNYWPSEITNLSDCHLQLTDFIESLVKPGTKTASTQYNMHGWCVHPITNVWGYTAPGEDAGWGLHVGATGWICQHLWEHYAFTKDTAYLRKAWPVLKEACIFYFDWLVKNPATNKFVSGPAGSPENSFEAPDSSTAEISMGPSHDQEVIHDLFSSTLQAAQVLELNVQDDFVKRLKETDKELARPGIAKDGRLMEWAQEFEEKDPHHRHVSHLFALHPGNEITLDKTPALAAAARKSLEVRGDGGTGWSLAWKINFWARLHEGDSSLKLLNKLLAPPLHTEAVYNDGGGSFYNLFDACPPFQIDGNFGAAAGIAEMLLQSQEDFIELLPALPSAWKTGSVKGLCARGAFEIDMQWENNHLIKASLLSKKGGQCRIKYGTKEIMLPTKPNQRYDLAAVIK